MFAYAWEQGVPTLYVESSTLLSQFEESQSDSFGVWVDQQAQAQVTALEDGQLEDVDWLPNDRWGTYKSGVRRGLGINNYGPRCPPH